jgi:hypothetical protein
MAFITWDGTYPSNPLGANDSHIILGHSTLADVVVLSEFQNLDTAYQVWRDDHDRPDGRSLAGAIRVKGVNYQPPWHWAFNLLANDAQLALFESILEAAPTGQATLVDSWDVPSVVAIDVVLSVPDRYRTRVAPGWWLLQLEALEEI